MTSPSIQQIERNIRAARAQIELGAALERLRQNKDFKEIVLTGYFEREAIRLVHAKAEPHLQSEESQKSIVSQMDAIGNFRGFLDLIVRDAMLAEKSIGQAEEIRDEMLAEELARG